MKVDDLDNEYYFLLVVEANGQNYIPIKDKHRDIFSGIDVVYHHGDYPKIVCISNMREILQSTLAVCRERTISE